MPASDAESVFKVNASESVPTTVLPCFHSYESVPEPEIDGVVDALTLNVRDCPTDRSMADAADVETAGAGAPIANVNVRVAVAPFASVNVTVPE